jgi:resolvase
VYGYARVSSRDQNLARQREALAGVDLVVEETVSGRNVRDRPRLRTLIDFVQAGDTIRVTSIDRLARNTRDLLAIVDELVGKKVSLEFIDSPLLNVTTKEGKAMITIFAAFAELERESIRERQRAGIAIAKAQGKYAKARKLTPDQIASAQTQVAAGIPKARIARSLGVSRMTLHAALTQTGPYTPSTH